ncbi:MAG: peptidase C69 [Bacteroidetes bacterium GWF2_41_61]|nr:MAG: peptidase C69 [Bacteroidetes bacterium GWE2_40_15]OFY28217.1 MAG: peptidase C69 [Bacteroidetes bacterium GWF2_41_61]OFY91029.1 MAG: peptidase C69 [Bacteroidetes bacterium RIFOXYA12_FULL_40_10]HBG24362.1 dipeptidase [Rikenellaceae bacterium]HBZ26163.1 dipeptidase [Rikenellaceae bacterium]
MKRINYNLTWRVAGVLLFSLSGIQSGDACTNLLVTKGASVNGSSMVSYSADSHTRYGTLVHYPAKTYPKGSMVKIYEWGKDRYLGEIPQVERTYSVIGNMNEHQIIVGESTWGGVKSQFDPEGLVDYGSLMYLALQRAKTAREAIMVITELADRYGYASTGESISIADPNEVWFLEIIGKAPKKVNGVNVNKGAVWVAVRIPDGYISAHANQARITTFPLNDPENCLFSKDVISHAREQGLYKGSDANFSFADAYGPADASTIRGCDARVWSFFNKYAQEDMGQYLSYAMGDVSKKRMPLYVKANRKLSVKDVADMMRDHYEGTAMDMTKDIGAGGNSLPYRWRPMSFEVDGKSYLNERAIATQQTGFWFVGESRPNIPNEIGGIFWFGVDDAATSPLTPVYTSSSAISNHYALGNGSMIEYSQTSMFWITNRIAQFAYLRYNHIGAEVRSIIDRHENARLKEVEAIDKTAMMLYKENPEYVREFLTNYSVNTANGLFDKWKKLDEYLLVKYIDGNTKKQNPDGSFMNNGHSPLIPPAPDFPGYTEIWKKAVKEQAGCRLTL